MPPRWSPHGLGGHRGGGGGGVQKRRGGGGGGGGGGSSSSGLLAERLNGLDLQDPEGAAEALRAKHPEYRRQKQRVFLQQVQTAIQAVLARGGGTPAAQVGGRGLRMGLAAWRQAAGMQQQLRLRHRDLARAVPRCAPRAAPRSRRPSGRPGQASSSPTAACGAAGSSTRARAGAAAATAAPLMQAPQRAAPAAARPAAAAAAAGTGTRAQRSQGRLRPAG